MLPGPLSSDAGGEKSVNLRFCEIDRCSGTANLPGWRDVEGSCDASSLVAGLAVRREGGVVG